ncbi:MAG: hypothetical protein FWD11_08275, partial [Micrococcales bacterium]|nr:hypothetical protein [Micrococcales bacterium]
MSDLATTVPVTCEPTGPAMPTRTATWRKALRLVPLNLSGRIFRGGYAALGVFVGMFVVNYVLVLADAAPVITMEVDGVVTDKPALIPALGTALWTVPVLAAILIPARHYVRTLNLGASRGDFYRGTVLTVVGLSLGAGVVAQALHYTLDAVVGDRADVVGVNEAMGHYSRVPALGWLATAVAVLVMALIVQTVVLVQARWANRLVVLVPIDAVLATALVVTLFTSTLRHGLGRFLWWTMVGPSPFVQIPIGLATATA